MVGEMAQGLKARAALPADPRSIAAPGSDRSHFHRAVSIHNYGIYITKGFSWFHHKERIAAGEMARGGKALAVQVRSFELGPWNPHNINYPLTSTCTMAHSPPTEK